jgi:hypothetical protein
MANKRDLTTGEREVLADVFLTTLPYDKIAITDKIGLGDAPYTLPNPIGKYRYHVNIGEDWFAKDLSQTAKGSRLLVHEATHVWQGEHRWWEWSYVFGSGLCQSMSMLLSGDRDGAYAYTTGDDWTKYNAEQQAAIVEDWYRAKGDDMSVSSNRWPSLLSKLTF